jgi:hypothetical protein
MGGMGGMVGMGGMGGMGGDDYYGGDDIVVVGADATVVVSPPVVSPPVVSPPKGSDVCCQYESKCAGGGSMSGSMRSLAGATTAPTPSKVKPSDDYMYYDDDSCEYVCMKYAGQADKC